MLITGILEAVHEVIEVVLKVLEVVLEQTFQTANILGIHSEL